MAMPIQAVLTDPDHREEPDIEIYDTDSFLLIRAEETAERQERRPPARQD